MAEAVELLFTFELSLAWSESHGYRWCEEPAAEVRDEKLLTRLAEEVLREHPWLELSDHVRRNELAKEQRIGLRTVIDCRPKTPGAEVRHDHPISFIQGQRRFATRTVLVDQVPLTDAMISAGDVLCF